MWYLCLIEVTFLKLKTNSLSIIVDTGVHSVKIFFFEDFHTTNIAIPIYSETSVIQP